MHNVSNNLLQVASVVGRAELLSAIFYFLAFLTYVKISSDIMSVKDWLILTCTVFLATCSMLSKEPGITVLGVCITYDIFKLWPKLFAFETECIKVDQWPLRYKERILSWKTWKIKENYSAIANVAKRIS